MKPFLQHQARFFFWGKRTYVHGSHILYGLLDAAEAAGMQPVTRIAAAFRSNLTQQGRYLFFRSAADIQAPAEPYPASLELETPEGVSFVGLTPGGGDVTDREPCDEEALIRGCRIDADAGTAFVEGYPAAPWINVIIALTKRLHVAMFPSVKYGPWFLGKIELAPPLLAQTQAGPLAVRMTSHIGEKMTRSRLEMGGMPLGTICFNRKALA